MSWRLPNGINWTTVYESHSKRNSLKDLKTLTFQLRVYRGCPTATRLSFYVLATDLYIE